MKEYRCFNCKRLLFKGEFVGKVEIKCSHCRKMFVYEEKTHVYDVIEYKEVKIVFDN